MDTKKLFTQSQLQAIGDALGDTSEGLTGSEIAHLLASAKMLDPSPDIFHAVLEAAKSVAEKIRARSGLTDDGAVLADRALGGDPPIIAINAFNTDSEKSEQRGFANIVKGTFAMFRNPTAHAPKINWAVNREDAEEVLTLLSMVHKRIDATHILSRP